MRVEGSWVRVEVIRKVVGFGMHLKDPVGFAKNCEWGMREREIKDDYRVLGLSLLLNGGRETWVRNRLRRKWKQEFGYEYIKFEMIIRHINAEAMYQVDM